MTELIDKIITELTKVTPFDVEIDLNPSIPIDSLPVQGETIWKEFIKYKRKSDRKRMLLYMYNRPPLQSPPI